MKGGIRRMRATRHNGRSGKHGVYNPKHNDRKFDIANSCLLYTSPSPRDRKPSRMPSSA